MKYGLVCCHFKAIGASSFCPGGVEQKKQESGLAEQACITGSSSHESSSLVSSSLVSSSLGSSSLESSNHASSRHESSSLESSSHESSSLMVDEDVSFTFKPEAFGGLGNLQVIFWVEVAGSWYLDLALSVSVSLS